MTVFCRAEGCLFAESGTREAACELYEEYGDKGGDASELRACEKSSMESFLSMIFLFSFRVRERRGSLATKP